MNTIGPISPTAFDGPPYAVPIHDAYSLYSNVMCVAGEDEIAEYIIELFTCWGRQTGHAFLTVRFHHGTEFQGALYAWCKRLGGRREYITVYTPEQNGRSERMNRTHIEGSHILLFQMYEHVIHITLRIDFPSFVGAVMFLATTSRPDIAYSLGVSSRFVAAPKAFHEPFVKRLLTH
jgi:hypothetical protein